MRSIDASAAWLTVRRRIDLPRWKFGDQVRPMHHRILFLSDHGPDRSSRDALARRGFQVTTAHSFEAAHHLSETEFGLVIIDVADPATGSELVKMVRSSRSPSGAILVLAEWGTGQATLALSQGADAFEAKPITAGRLLEAVESILQPSLVKAAKAATADAEPEE